jgi:fermentation-respiration switch protein FrsA (DUF1100 family)
LSTIKIEKEEDVDYSNPTSKKKDRSIWGNLMLKWTIGVILSLLVVYFVVGIVSATTVTLPERIFSEDILPDRTYEDVRFPSRGEEVEIAGWYIYREGNTKALILVHGKDSSRTREFDGTMVTLAGDLVDAGFDVLMIDMRGHGQSGDGRYSFGINERLDVLGAVDWLKTKGFKPGSIGALGVSMGGAAAIGATADDTDIGAIIVDSTFADIYPLILQEWTNESGLPNFFIPSMRLMNQWLYGYDVAEARPVDEISQIAPRGLMIIHCTTDTLVPFSQAEELIAAAPFAHTWIVDGCDHAKLILSDFQPYCDQVIGFFDEHLN